MPKLKYAFTLHGDLTIEADSEEEAYELITDVLGSLTLSDLPTLLRNQVSNLTINEVETEQREEE